jgi:hypothetical protein
MDRFMVSLSAIEDHDLMLCLKDGIAYQRDQSELVEYNGSYFDKCASYRGQEIANKLNAGRIAFVRKHYGNGSVLDIGIGSGEFLQHRPGTYGMDVNPVAIRWLLQNNLWADDIETFHAFTAWDVIEHVPTPGHYFDRMRVGAYLFASLPIFPDLRRIRESKHYRPGEHLFYFTECGFVDWMMWHGFTHLETQDFETQAGRDSILSFAFRRLPG